MEIENDKRFEQWEEFDGGSCNDRSYIDRNCNDGGFNYMEIGNDGRFDNGGFEQWEEFNDCNDGKFNYGNCNDRNWIDRNCHDGRFSYVEIVAMMEDSINEDFEQ